MHLRASSWAKRERPFLPIWVASWRPPAAARCARFLRPIAPGSAPTRAPGWPPQKASKGRVRSAKGEASNSASTSRSSATSWKYGHGSCGSAHWGKRGVPATGTILKAVSRARMSLRRTGTAIALPMALRRRMCIGLGSRSFGGSSTNDSEGTVQPTGNPMARSISSGDKMRGAEPVAGPHGIGHSKPKSCQTLMAEAQSDWAHRTFCWGSAA